MLVTNLIFSPLLVAPTLHPGTTCSMDTDCGSNAQCDDGLCRCRDAFILLRHGCGESGWAESISFRLSCVVRWSVVE